MNQSVTIDDCFEIVQRAVQCDNEASDAINTISMRFVRMADALQKYGEALGHLSLEDHKKGITEKDAYTISKAYYQGQRSSKYNYQNSQQPLAH